MGYVQRLEGHVSMHAIFCWCLVCESILVASGEEERDYGRRRSCEVGETRYAFLKLGLWGLE